ncbi:SURF1 family protein [Mycobacterium xenopi 3993]|nr:SURF1 family protein [Mycobacterium xenopi 3993]
MRRFAFLLRPGWLALALVVIAFTYLCFTVLAPWQLGKNAKTSRENSQIEHSLNTAPVPLKDLLPQQDSSAPDAQWRRVTATGHYLPEVQVLAGCEWSTVIRRSRYWRRSSLTADPPCWSTAVTCVPSRARRCRRYPAAQGHGDHHRAAAQLRSERTR